MKLQSHIKRQLMEMMGLSEREANEIATIAVNVLIDKLDIQLLREVVDQAWMSATESTTVPSSLLADRIISKARDALKAKS